MVGRKLDRYKYKWKYRIVSAAYVAFLLAESGEFFVSHNLNPHKNHSNDSTRLVLEIPDHIPEKADEQYSKHRQVCYRDAGDNNKKKCVEIILPLTG